MTTVGTSSVPCLASGPSRGHSGDVLAIVAPGQGAQKPGFLSDWMSDATFSDHLAWLSAVADIDLVTHGTTSDEATIKDTAVAQPLLVAAALGGALGWLTALDEVSLMLGMMPGGITELCLTAEALQLSVALVTALQVLRLSLVMFLAEPLFKLWCKSHA